MNTINYFWEWRLMSPRFRTFVMDDAGRALTGPYAAFYLEIGFAHINPGTSGTVMNAPWQEFIEERSRTRLVHLEGWRELSSE